MATPYFFIQGDMEFKCVYLKNKKTIIMSNSYYKGPGVLIADVHFLDNQTIWSEGDGPPDEVPMIPFQNLFYRNDMDLYVEYDQSNPNDRFLRVKNGLYYFTVTYTMDITYVSTKPEDQYAVLVIATATGAADYFEPINSYEAFVPIGFTTSSFTPPFTVGDRVYTRTLSGQIIVSNSQELQLKFVVSIEQTDPVVKQLKIQDNQFTLTMFRYGEAH